MRNLQHKVAVAIVIAALSTSAFAQFGSGMGGMGGMGGGRRGRGAEPPSATRSGEPSSNPMLLADKVRDKLYDLRLRLLITPGQSTLWDNFSARLWDLSTHPASARAAADDEQTALQSVRRRTAEAQQRAAQFRALSESMELLYAAFTPEQRQLADQYLPSALP